MILSSIKVFSPTSDGLSLQDALHIHGWSQRNNIAFNASKCKTLSVTRKKSPLLHHYPMDCVHLERVRDEKDLGVTITNTLSWELHIQSITAKANKLLGLLKRTRPLLKDVSLRRTLYLSLVKSQLSYATHAWSPAQLGLLGQKGQY